MGTTYNWILTLHLLHFSVQSSPHRPQDITFQNRIEYKYSAQDTTIPFGEGGLRPPITKTGDTPPKLGWGAGPQLPLIPDANGKLYLQGTSSFSARLTSIMLIRIRRIARGDESASDNGESASDLMDSRLEKWGVSLF
jgi:hypothetical protein